MEKMKGLLQQVSIIQKKYEDLAEYTGEHYNVFDILGVTSDELSHSAILTNLLDTKGIHGQKDVFLKLFLAQISNRFSNPKFKTYFEDFDTTNATAKKEVYIGPVRNNEGGRIDILITSSGKNIVIENKIYAGDQNQQLLRYKNAKNESPILYLTLNGNEPSDLSKSGLKIEADFICCSYQNDIKDWLEKCIKEMANKPFIRETLNQYLSLIKRLTNQSNSNKMNNEISNLVLSSKESFDSFKAINNAYNDVSQKIINGFIDELKCYDLIVDEGFRSGVRYSGFSISNADLKAQNIDIRFEFQSPNYKEPLLGFRYHDRSNRERDKHEIIIKEFHYLLKSAITTSNGFLCYAWYPDLNNMNSLNTMEGLQYGHLKTNFMSIIRSMLAIVENSVVMSSKKN